jgi:hypothetical protein
MATTKEPDVKRIYTRTVTRFRVPERPQLTISGEPEVQSVTTTITPYYVAQIATLRLLVGGERGGWQPALDVSPNDDYTATNMALAETNLIEQGLPDWSDARDAIQSWRIEMRRRGDGEGEQGGEAPEAPGDAG